jgi:hypothetical protein
MESILKPEQIEKLKKENPKSIFIGDEWDNHIIEVNEDGAVVYSYYDLLYGMMDERKDEYDGDDYEKGKEEHNQDFSDFYEIINEQLLLSFDNFKLDSGIPPRLKYWGTDENDGEYVDDEDDDDE